jgi:type 1 fimbriae regulatory protein FimB/type 1 fimbriae regulatory protein FimE
VPAFRAAFPNLRRAPLAHFQRDDGAGPRIKGACGYALANKGHDTRAIQAWLGHRSITSTAVYTALEPNRFKDFWRD